MILCISVLRLNLCLIKYLVVVVKSVLLFVGLEMCMLLMGDIKLIFMKFVYMWLVIEWVKYGLEGEVS